MIVDYNSKTQTELLSILNFFDLINKLKALFLKQDRRPYKVATILVSKSGDDLVVKELENTLGTITVAEESTGNYTITSDGLFTEDKTWLSISNRDFNYYSEFGQNDVDSLFFTIKLREDDTDTDLINNPISMEIRVYN